MPHPDAPHPHAMRGRCAWPLRLACAAWLAFVALGASAAPIYRCTGADGHLAFRDTPCGARARQAKLDVTGQPLIDANAPPAVERPSSNRAGPRRGSATRTRVARPKAKETTSWECRAADGEVFYRHTRCPASIPGDGVVRAGYAETQATTRGRRRHDAWERVPVHGVKVPRSEACRRIHGAGAAGRDGRDHDDAASAYDRLMGRDPCGAG